MLPRPVLPGKFYMITRRATQRQFLLRPDAETNNTFLYMLAEAALRFGIVVLLRFVASKHHHTIVYDPTGRIIEFIEHLHKFVAKIQNAWLGRWENLWASEPPCLVELVGVEDVMEKQVYAATNPVKDGLVERVHHWPGVNGLSDLLNRRLITARRPRHFFRADSRMPETVTLELVLPAALGDADQLHRTIRERVAAVEAAAAAERSRTGARVLGRRAILARAAVHVIISTRRQGALGLQSLGSFLAPPCCLRDSSPRRTTRRTSHRLGPSFAGTLPAWQRPRIRSAMESWSRDRIGAPR